MKKTNPFLNSDDHKRYHTWNYYCKHNYHKKIYKVALNANLGCPNRDGICGVGGCIFCSLSGSGDFAGKVEDSLETQFALGKQKMLTKYPSASAIPYFQAYTNTYAPLAHLKTLYEPFIMMEDIEAIVIATRADCLGEDVVEYLESLTTKKDIWLEIGVQSIHNKSALFINRGHLYDVFNDCIERLSHTHIKICVHLINSLPYETQKEMIESAQTITSLPIHAIKIHMLHIMHNTKLAQIYNKTPFPIFDKEMYIDTLIQQLEVLPPHIVIQRVTGDAPKDELLTPLWTRNKLVVLNDIDKEMKRRDTWQGKKYVDPFSN